MTCAVRPPRASRYLPTRRRPLHWRGVPVTTPKLAGEKETHRHSSPSDAGVSQQDHGAPMPVRRLAAACALFAGASLAQQQAASPLPPLAAAQAVSVGDAFRKLSGDTWVARSVSLADLGFAPIVLGYPDANRAIELPVPPNVALANATLQMDASFVRAD